MYPAHRYKHTDTQTHMSGFHPDPLRELMRSQDPLATMGAYLAAWRSG